MMKAFLILLSLSCILPCPGFCADTHASDTAHVIYTCPMHPNVKAEQPGYCPICHMHLEKVAVKNDHASDSKTAQGRIKFYRNPMDPSKTSPKPMKDSMGMDYIPVYENGTQGEHTADNRSTISVSDDHFKLGGGTLVHVARRALTQEIRAVARVVSGSQVSIQIQESDLAALRPGARFSAQSPALPGTRIEGRTEGRDSVLDPTTRTLRLNGQLLGLKTPLPSEASLTVTIILPHESALALPEQAVMHTGTQDLVFIARGDGQFEPRPVELGIQAQGYFEVKSGVSEGDAVSAGPNFLFDSEARIQASHD